MIAGAGLCGLLFAVVSLAQTVTPNPDCSLSPDCLRDLSPPARHIMNIALVILQSVVRDPDVLCHED